MAKIPPPVPVLVDDDGELEVIELDERPIEAAENFVSLFKSFISSSIKNIPKFISNNIYILIPLLIAWTELESINDFKIMTLPKPLSSLIKILIFLTASYNNFLAKGLYVIALNSSVIPIAKSIKSKGVESIIADFKRTFSLIKKSYETLKGKSTGIILTYLGVSFIFSNLLTRNNKIDKYFISLLLSFSLLNSLNKGFKNIFIRLFKSLIMKLSKNIISREYLYLSIGSLSFGFLISFIFSFIRFTNSYYDFTGYVIGGLLLISGIVLSLRGKAVEK